VVRRVCSLKTPRHQILTGNFHEYAKRELTDGWRKRHNWCRRLHRSARGVSVFAQSGRGWFRSGFPRITNVSVFVSKRVGFAPLKPRCRNQFDPGVFLCAHQRPLARNRVKRPVFLAVFATTPAATRLGTRSPTHNPRHRKNVAGTPFGAKSLPKTRDRRTRVIWRLRSLWCVERFKTMTAGL
jgi:hypothetical protein